MCDPLKKCSYFELLITHYDYILKLNTKKYVLIHKCSI